MLSIMLCDRVLAILICLTFNLNWYLVNAGQLENLNLELPNDAPQFAPQHHLQSHDPHQHDSQLSHQMLSHPMAQSPHHHHHHSGYHHHGSGHGSMGGGERLSIFPFYIDPLIIIAMIALPTIGLLGLSSLIMPLIPIALYLIQLFFPVGSSGKRRKRDQSYFNVSNFDADNVFDDKEIKLFIINLSKAFDKYDNNTL